MPTVDKALSLLKRFSVETPAWGLSDLARSARMNKATTLRLLQALTRHGVLEQDPETRQFRLGVAVLNLAKVREASSPLTSVIEPVLARLTRQTGETSHASIGVGATMTVIGVEEPPRATRAVVDLSIDLPIHATASGIAYLAFAEEETLLGVLEANALQSFTDMTPVDRTTIQSLVGWTRRHGFSIGARSYDDEVVGVAAPVFNKRGWALGAIAVATPSHRMTREKLLATAARVAEAAGETTKGIGGQPAKGYSVTARPELQPELEHMITGANG